MTKDLIRHTAIARALVILLTNPDHDVADPHVRAGFEAVINALGEEAEKTSQAETTLQVELLEAMRNHGSDLFDAQDDETRSKAMESLAEDFARFAETIPGYEG